MSGMLKHEHDDKIELEADTLLNGVIFTPKDRRRPFSPQAQFQLGTVQLFKQPEQIKTQTDFTLSGNAYDANTDRKIGSFELGKP